MNNLDLYKLFYVKLFCLYVNVIEVPNFHNFKRQNCSVTLIYTTDAFAICLAT